MKNALITLCFLSVVFNACKTEGNATKSVSQEGENFKKEALALAKDPSQLILGEASIANFDLNGILNEVSISYLEDQFANFNIEIVSYEGYDEKGPKTYYSGWKGGSLFSMTFDNSDGSNVVETFNVNSKGIVDQYGVKIGMSFKELQLLRKGFKIKTSPITMQPEVVYSNSSIYYVFCCTNTQKETYTSEDLMTMKIQSIGWSMGYNVPED